MSKTNELTKAEWVVIRQIWDMEPCTAPEVQESLFKATQWTYSTVRTIMDRMVVKGILSTTREGKLTIYRSVLTRAQAQKTEALYALKEAFDGALTPMVQCLIDSKKISEQDLNELEALIRARRKHK